MGDKKQECCRCLPQSDSITGLNRVRLLLSNHSFMCWPVAAAFLKIFHSCIQSSLAGLQ